MADPKPTGGGHGTGGGGGGGGGSPPQQKSANVGGGGGANRGGGNGRAPRAETELKEALLKKKLLKKRGSKGSGAAEEGKKAAEGGGGGGEEGGKIESKGEGKQGESKGESKPEGREGRKRDACSVPGSVLPDRPRRKPRRRGGGGRRSPPPGGPPGDSRDFYRGPPPDARDFYRGDYRGDPYYGRGPPRDFYDDRRGPPPPRGWRDERDYGGRYGGPPPSSRGRPPVRGDMYGRDPPHRGGGEGDRRGGGRGRSHSLSSRSSSASRSKSRSRSRSGSRSYSSRSRSGGQSCSSRSWSYSRSPSGEGGSKADHKRSAGSRSPSPDDDDDDDEADESNKEQRTVFVSQLVMRATEADLAHYFRRTVGTKVREVVLLGRDPRTGRHKGCAYVELGRVTDVERALAGGGKTPDFQRFPILVKRTEGERNAAVAGGGGGAAFVPPRVAGVAGVPPLRVTADGRRVESQKVYVGSIDRVVTQAQLYALFSQFGPLDKILLQMDAATGMSRGFAFLSYRDPKDANLAIRTMNGQPLAGRPLKTGWANQQASAAGVVEVTSDEFPADANEKIQRANAAMQQLTGTSLAATIGQGNAGSPRALLAAGPAGALGIVPSDKLASVADAALDAAMGVPTTAAAATVAAPAAAAPVVDAKVVGRSDNPTRHILVHNMFDKDQETEKGWEQDIKLDFEEECGQYGKITSVTVMSKDPGGKIYASFDSVDGAASCAKNLAGRWFDKRQLRVEFVDSVPDS